MAEPYVPLLTSIEGVGDSIFIPEPAVVSAALNFVSNRTYACRLDKSDRPKYSGWEKESVRVEVHSLFPVSRDSFTLPSVSDFLRPTRPRSQDRRVYSEESSSIHIRVLSP